jgi:hypothetical protein
MLHVQGFGGLGPEPLSTNSWFNATQEQRHHVLVSHPMARASDDQVQVTSERPLQNPAATIEVTVAS